MRLLPDREVAARYGVTTRTLWRWDHRPQLGFPRPIRINGRKYRRECELDEFDRAHHGIATTHTNWEISGSSQGRAWPTIPRRHVSPWHSHAVDKSRPRRRASLTCGLTLPRWLAAS